MIVVRNRPPGFQLFTGALAIALAASALPGWGQTEDYAAERRSLLERYESLRRQSSPDALQEFVEGEASKAKSLPRDDQRRANAAELLVRLRIAQSQFADLVPLTSELVRSRGTQNPKNDELLANALLLHATALFAANRGADADRALEQMLVHFRASFPANDLRLAVQLEKSAQYVAHGYGRPFTEANLYSEAIRIREGAEAKPSLDLASSLESLAMLEMDKLRRPELAEVHLDKSLSILLAQLAEHTGSDSIRAGIVQILVLKSGLARERGATREALSMLDRARSYGCADPDLQLDNEEAIGLGRAYVLEANDQVEEAIAENQRIVELLHAAAQQGRLNEDRRGLAIDLTVGNGRLFLRLGNLEAARQTAEFAIKAYAADDPKVTDAQFLLAEVERREGNSEQQLRTYREALKRSKQAASEELVLFATTRALLPGTKKEKADFGGDVGEAITYGRAIALVPGGQFSSEASLRPEEAVSVTYGATINPDYLSIGSKEVATKAEVMEAARRRAAAAHLYPRSALVFIHGYNVTFDDAVKRMGQLVRDLNYDGAGFVFSWPSRGQWWRYGTDRESAEQASTRLAAFLKLVAENTGAEHIHLIAHSMGNRVLLPALERLDADLSQKIGEIVFAAPAVGVDEFKERLSTLKTRGLTRMTLYASQYDKALRAGFLREFGTTLAGYVAQGKPFLAPAVDTIDVSEAGDASFEFNHDVFAANPAIMDDIRQLLQRGVRPPASRLKELHEVSSDSGPSYWHYRRN